MPKVKVSEWSQTASANTDINSIDINEGCAPSSLNNAIREVMAQIKDMQLGADGDNFAVGGTLAVTGTSALTGATTVSGVLTASSGVVGNVTGNVTGNTSGTAANVTGIVAVANGGTGVSSLGTGVVTFLGTPTSANLAAAVTNETGSGSLVFATSPTLVTPVLGTPSSGTLTSCTGLPLTTGVTGTLPVANGGTGVTSSTGTTSVVLSASPTFTGVPLAPTAAAGTSTTQLATTAFATTAIQALHPVGSIYTSTVATNPATLFGFGTWVAFGAGRVLIGVSGTAPYTAGATGGSADAVVVAHTHTGTTDSTSLTGTVGNIAESYASSGTATGVFTKGTGTSSGTPTSTDTSASGSFSMNATHTHPFTTASTGVSATNANLSPYVVVYMWNRTA
jgi:hypothetical protein